MNTNYIFEVSDVINAALAIAIGCLASIAFKSIRETRNIAQKERRVRLLDDIIHWADYIASWPSRHWDAYRMVLQGDSNRLIGEREWVRINEIMDDFHGMRGRNEYAIQTSNMFNQRLREAVLSLEETMERYVAHLGAWERKLDRKLKPGERVLREEMTEDITEANNISLLMERQARSVIYAAFTAKRELL